jgi:hypothetical protein
MLWAGQAQLSVFRSRTAQRGLCKSPVWQISTKRVEFANRDPELSLLGPGLLLPSLPRSLPQLIEGPERGSGWGGEPEWWGLGGIQNGQERCRGRERNGLWQERRQCHCAGTDLLHVPQQLFRVKLRLDQPGSLGSRPSDSRQTPPAAPIQLAGGAGSLPAGWVLGRFRPV